MVKNCKRQLEKVLSKKTWMKTSFTLEQGCTNYFKFCTHSKDIYLPTKYHPGGRTHRIGLKCLSFSKFEYVFSIKNNFVFISIECYS